MVWHKIHHKLVNITSKIGNQFWLLPKLGIDTTDSVNLTKCD